MKKTSKKQPVERPDTKGLVILDIILGVLTLFSVFVVGAAVIASVFHPKEFRSKVADKAMEMNSDKMMAMMERMDKSMMDKDTMDSSIELLFVQEAASATLTTEDAVSTLTLSGVDADTVYFSDRPNRVAGKMATEDLVTEWNTGKDSFQVDPPNAAVQYAGSETAAIVELSNPVYDAASGTLAYTVKTVGNTSEAFSQLSVSAGSELPETMEDLTLFIDSSAGAHICVAGICISGGGSINP